MVGVLVLVSEVFDYCLSLKPGVKVILVLIVCTICLWVVKFAPLLVFIYKKGLLSVFLDSMPRKNVEIEYLLLIISFEAVFDLLVGLNATAHILIQ